jgi:superfamily I DNA/RNA helicase
MVGFNCLKYHYKEPILDNDKYIKLINKVYKNLSNKSELLNIINIIRKRNLDENILKTNEEINNYFNKYNVSVNIELLKKAFQLVKIGSFDLTSVDFIDMLYIPINKKLKTLWYDYVFVDECQDLNELQILLLKKLVNPISGRLVCVGDPNQAIYAFNGADPESFNRLSYLCNNKLTLSKNYRCGVDIINEAKKLTPDINSGLDLKGELVYEGSIYDIEDGD